ncbi:MAG: hypothetical protein SVK08_00775 [Halobacteriota archaeon]|nr:hypothetical protein [Halobacteriota archaeon]
MKINFGQGYTLTTEHPASHYGLGVLLDEKNNVYGPADRMIADTETTKLFDTFGDIQMPTAGEYILKRSIERIWPSAEIELMRRFVSQDPSAHSRFLVSPL